MNNAREIWGQMLGKLETCLSVVDFDVWISKIEPVAVKGAKLVLLAPSDKNKDFIDSRLRPLIMNVMKQVNPLLTALEIIEPSEAVKYEEKDETADAVDEEEPKHTLDVTVLNPKYNFENFVVGNSNRFVYAAARAVADEPGLRYNPLFIYGGVGLGKTHMMHAIGNYLRTNRQDLKVLYVSSEKFLTEFVASIRASKGTSDNFREKYRNADVLMIDDIQFIAGKQGMQEEVFHTFNDMYQSNKQLIMTSDRPPKEIRDLEERLRSRFEWGLIADIQPPDLETRIAILQKKAQLEHCSLPMEVLTFMAEKIDTNIREMEGLLNKVIFLSKLSTSEPTVDMVKEVLRDYGSESGTPTSAEDIIDATCRYFRISREDLVGKKKTKEVVEPRQLCIYLITDMLDLPLATIGNLFGGRDHTTVMHARDKMSEKVNTVTRLSVAAGDIRDLVKRK
ncbi:MAG: chromosomal replication initiator protein DnaA [Clostridia bacterium]|nr:chromosomal replication initiator protein DnaA [Clostridia bacterium]